MAQNVQAFVTEMNKAFSKKYDKPVIYAGSDEKFQVKKIPTGILSVDILTGGGLPIGRWSEIYGQESLLKTSIAMMAISEAQRMGFAGMYCDVERNVGTELFEMRGVDTDESALTVVQADLAEDYIDIIKAAMKQEVYKVIVLDSISALFTKREAESKSGEAVGTQGLFTSKMGRVLTASNDNSTALVLINQTREKIGVMFGDSTTRSGGLAPKFYDSTTLRLTKIGTNRIALQGDKKGRGHRRVSSIEIAVELEKSKVGGQHGGETVMHYDMINSRIDEASEIISLGQYYGIIRKSGRQLQVGKQKMFETQLREKLNKSPRLRRRLRQAIP